MDLEKLRCYDEGALGHLFCIVEQLWNRKLSPEEVSRIYREGITVVFMGNGFHSALEMNYACFYAKANRRLPLKISVRCFASANTSHKEIIHFDDINRLIVAGIISNGVFRSFSSTWLTHVNPESARCRLGSYLNEILLRSYLLEDSPTGCAVC